MAFLYDLFFSLSFGFVFSSWPAFMQADCLKNFSLLVFFPFWQVCMQADVKNVFFSLLFFSPPFGTRHLKDAHLFLFVLMLDSGTKCVISRCWIRYIYKEYEAISISSSLNFVYQTGSICFFTVFLSGRYFKHFMVNGHPWRLS